MSEPTTEAKEYNIYFQLSHREAEAFEAYRKRIDCSQAGAIICLIRGALMQQSELHKNAFDDLFEDYNVKALNEDFKHTKSVLKCLCEHDEKHDEQIAQLEDRFDRLTEITKQVLDLVKPIIEGQG